MHRICLPITFFVNVLCEPVEYEKQIDPRRSRYATELSSVDAQSLKGYCLQDIAETPSRSEVTKETIVLSDEVSGKKISIDKELEKRLLSYLKDPPPTEPYSCVSFVQRMLGIEGDVIAALYQRGWSWSEYISEALVNVGDLVLLFASDDNNRLQHIAIKATPQLYLSKGGPHAPYLMLLEMEAMTFLWRASKTIVLRPGPSSATNGGAGGAMQDLAGALLGK